MIPLSRLIVSRSLFITELSKISNNDVWQDIAILKIGNVVNSPDVFQYDMFSLSGASFSNINLSVVSNISFNIRQEYNIIDNTDNDVKLSTFLSRLKGRATNILKIMTVVIRKWRSYLISNNSVRILGAKSPIIIKYATQVPNKKPISPISTKNLPVDPRISWTISSKLLRFARKADFNKKWHDNLVRKPLKTISTIDNNNPLCTKQYGMANMDTPIILLPKLTVLPKDISIYFGGEGLEGGHRGRNINITDGSLYEVNFLRMDFSQTHVNMVILPIVQCRVGE